MRSLPPNDPAKPAAGPCVPCPTSHLLLQRLPGALLSLNVHYAISVCGAVTCPVPMPAAVPPVSFPPGAARRLALPALALACLAHVLTASQIPSSPSRLVPRANAPSPFARVDPSSIGGPPAP